MTEPGATYRFTIAQTPNDYKLCHALARETATPIKQLSFPTVLGYEGDTFVGFMSTFLGEGLIVAGPMVIKPDKRRPRLALRLGENYENAMRSMGVHSFIMSVERDSVMHDAVKRYTGMEPYAEEENTLFFVRRI
jgi:hypothetical protein